MAGRNATLSILKTSDSSAGEIPERQDTEKRLEFLCPGKLKKPECVRSDRVASKKWDQITKIYKQAEFKLVGEGDDATLTRYCLCWSEYLQLVEQRNVISELTPPEKEDRDAISEETEQARGKKVADLIWKKIDYILSTDGILKIDAAINSKIATINALEDRLFLNPLAKIKNIIKLKDTVKEQTSEMAAAGFGDI
jgi:phage terminase small subunit